MAALSQFFTALLDLLFPRTGLEREIAALSLEELARKMKPVERDGTLALFSYRNPLIRKMVWMLKYQGDRRVARLFGQALHAALLEELSDAAIFSPGSAFFLVPVPLSSRRRRARGFNQMERVAEAAAAYGGFELRPEMLARTKDAPSQTSIKDKLARTKNVARAFRAPDRLPENATIVLIDDVITTGSTMREAAAALRENGARVICVALAH